MEKVLVTGVHGFVGARVMEAFPGAVPFPSTLLHVDFGMEKNIAAVKDFVKSVNPTLLIHTAAISDVQDCEKAPEDSYKVNVLLTVALAEAAKDCGAKLICFSSDQVYTGCVAKGPYKEDEVFEAPANTYGRHKLESEKRVLEILPSAVMLRATWMYDMPLYNHGNRGNFLMNTLKSAIAGREMRASSEEYRGLTYVRPVAEFLHQVAKIPGGVYNYGSEADANLHDTTLALLDALKFTGAKSLVTDGKADHNLWMDCTKLKNAGVHFDSTVQGFAHVVRDYSLDK